MINFLIKTFILEKFVIVECKKILLLNGFSYDYILNESDKLDDKISARFLNDNKNQIGLLAQDLIKIVPEAVKQDEHTGNYSVNYIMIIPLLIESIKKQQEQLNLLQHKVELITK